MEQKEIYKQTIDLIKPPVSDGSDSNIIGGEIFRSIATHVLRQAKELVGTTAGPGGYNIVIQTGPKKDDIHSTKDGKTVLSYMNYPGDVASAVLSFLQYVATRVVKEVGDGSTASIVASDTFYEYMDINLRKYRPKQITKTIEKLEKEILAELDKEAKRLEVDSKYLLDLACVSLNNDLEQARLVQEAYETAGRDSIVNLELAFGEENITIKNTKAYGIDSGFLDPIQINDPLTSTIELKDVDVYVFDSAILTNEIGEKINTLVTAYLSRQYGPHAVGSEPRGLLLIAPNYGKIVRDLFSETYRKAIMNKQNNPMYPLPKLSLLEVPRDTKTDTFYEDVAAKVGAQIIRLSAYEDEKMDFSKIDEMYVSDVEVRNEVGEELDNLISIVNYRGTVEKLSMSKSHTLLYGCGGLEEIIKARRQAIVDNIDTMVALPGDYEYELLKERKRLNNFDENVVTIRIGGVTESEMASKKDLFEDAILACKSALKYGYIQGGHVTLLKVLRKMLEKHSLTTIEKLIIDGYIFTFETVLRLVISNAVSTEEEEKELFDKIPTLTKMFDITGEDKNIINSVQTDKEILKSINSIIGLLYSSKGMLTRNSLNRYMKPGDTQMQGLPW